MCSVGTRILSRLFCGISVLAGISTAHAEVPLPRSRPQIVLMQGSQTCLARAIYEEARGEPEEGQLMVGYVVYYRALLDLPGVGGPTICGVVLRQYRQGAKVRRQFSGVKDDAAWIPKNPDSWKLALAYARKILMGRFDPGGEMHYATHYLNPKTASTEGFCWFHRKLKPIQRVGMHVFFREPLPKEVTELQGDMPEECQPPKKIAAR